MSLSLHKHWNGWLIAALVLSLLGLKLEILADHGSDVPPAGDWATEVQGLYQPWLHRASDAAGVIATVISSPDPAARIWKLLWLRGNGQWDPRLLGLAAAGLFGLAALVFFPAVLRTSSPGAALILALATLSFFAFPNVRGATLDASQAWAGFLLLFSAAHLAGTALRRPHSTWRRAGHFAGLANVLASTAGLASPLAVLIWVAVAPQERRRGSAPSFLWNATLVVLGLGRLLWAFPHPGWPKLDGAALLHLGAWPLSWPGAAAITCAPSLALLAWTSRPAWDRPSIPLARLAAIWALILIAVLSCPGVMPAGVPPATVLAVVLLVQLSALLAFPTARSNGSIAKAYVATVWLVLILDGLFQQSRLLPDAGQRTRAHEEQAAGVRHFLADDQPGDLQDATGENPGRAEEVARLLRDEAVRAILPASIRLPLPLIPSRAATAFRAGGAPELAGKPALLPTWGTWSPAGAAARGGFASEDLHTAAPLLQIYVAGSLRPPFSSVELQTADGGVIGPIEPRAEATARWKQLNFATPTGAFRVVARAAAPGRWLAFSAPLETGRLAWIGRKLAALWPWILGFGIVLLCYAGSGAASAGWRARDATGMRSTFLAWARRAPWLGVFAYTVFLANFINIYAAASDASGYLNSAKLMLRGCLMLPPRIIPGISTSLQLLTPLGFDVYRGKIAPGYPAGLPLMLAAVGRLSSLDLAIPAVVIAHLVLGIFFTRRLAAVCGLGGVASWVAAGALALCPLYVFMGLQPMSDMPSLVWVTAAVYFALSSRDEPRRALWSGAACALAVLVRPTNAICLVPVALALGGSARRLKFLVLGGLPGAIFATWYNLRLFGSPFHTAYGDVGHLFSAHWIRPTFHTYVLWLPAYFTPLIALAVAGPWARGLTRPARWALPACVLAYFGFFSLYVFTHLTWWYLRFVLPAFPCAVILAVTAGRDLLGRGFPRGGRVRTALSIVLLGWFAGNVAWQFSRLPVLYSRRGNQFYRDSTRWIEEHAPPDAVVLSFQASGAVYYYTNHPIVRAEAGTPSEPETIAIVRQLVAQGRPAYALVVPYDTVPPIATLPGHWEHAASIETAEIWRLTGKK